MAVNSTLFSRLQGLIEDPEEPAVLRLTIMVQHLFHVPVAYMALRGRDTQVVRRIGVGSEHSEAIRKIVDLDASWVRNTVVPDAVERLHEAVAEGGIRFVATAPLCSSTGDSLGVLVIADTKERPDFSETDHSALKSLADVLAARMELAMTAAQALAAELEAEETVLRFRAIADCLPALISYAEADGWCAYVNRTWLEFTGRKIQDEIGEGWADALAPECRQAVLDTYWEAFQARKAFCVECRMRRHDGEYRWMKGWGTPRFDRDGSFAGYVGCLMDNSENRGARDVVERQAQSLAALAKAVGASYAVVDSQGEIEQASDGFGKAWGQDAAELRKGVLAEALAGRTAVMGKTAGRTWTATPLPGGGSIVVMPRKGR